MSDKISFVKDVDTTSLVISNKLVDLVLTGKMSLDDLNVSSKSGKLAIYILETYYNDNPDKKG